MILVVILDSLLVGGIRFVLDKVAAAVDQEMNDEGSLREIRDRQREEAGGTAGAMSFQPGAFDVDVSFTADHTYGDERDEEEEP